MEDMEFGQILQQLLEENKMTQKQLSEELYIAPSTLNEYIKKKVEPEYAILRRLSRKFNISCDYLVGNSHLRISDGDYLNGRERHVIELMRKMDDSGQELLEEMAVLYFKKFQKEQ